MCWTRSVAVARVDGAICSALRRARQKTHYGRNILAVVPHALRPAYSDVFAARYLTQRQRWTVLTPRSVIPKQLC